MEAEVAQEVPEGFKLTEIGLLPEEWQVVPLGKVLASNKLALNPQDCVDELFEYYSIPAYQISNQPGLEKGGQIRSQKLLVESGTVLFGKLNPRVPKVWLVSSDSGKRKIASTEFIPMLPVQGRIVSRFLYYLAWSDHLMPKAQELISGSTPSRQRVDVRAFLGVRIPLPPVDEQQAIARVLAAIQRAIEATDRVIAAARQLKRSLMRHLFTYGPVPIAEAERVPLKGTEIGPVPQHWDVVRLEQCATVQTGVAKGRKLSPSDRTVSVPYLRVANVQAGYLDLSEIKDITIREAELPRYRLEAGDVVLTEGGDFDKLGRGFIWRNEIPGCVHQNHIFAVRAKRKVVSPEYLACLIQSQHSRSYFLTVAHRTTHLACINTRKLKALPLLIPCSDDQARIVETLSAIDTKIEVEEKRKAALKELFRTMLHLLMKGQVRVKDWHGADAKEVT